MIPISSYHWREGVTLSDEELLEQIVPYAVKFQWFFEHGYAPHYWQTLFHTMRNEDNLCRYRHLVAGRRGGKTLSAAWEVAFYCMNPREFHFDAHGQEKDRPLHVWVLTKDHVIGRAAWMTFQEVLTQAGFQHGVEYKEHRAGKRFEFENGSLVEFKTADEPQNLRGAGLDILWIDEAAFITNEEPFNVARPALSDKRGLVITTTTPAGKNWFYEMFWSEKAMERPDIGRVEYTSIHSPYFTREEWEEVLETYHPLMFKQEYMASFDSLAGVELSGEWLKYYENHELPKQDGRVDLSLFMGVDPAASLRDTADSFAAALVGVDNKVGQVYLLELFKGRIPFPDQVDLVNEWHLKYRPEVIGIESQAYQLVFVQQTLRLPTLPPVIPILAGGRKKTERILSMAPLFRIGKVRIRQDHRDFIDEWLNYDSTLKNPKDDALDAVEIALRTAGALLPEAPREQVFNHERKLSLEELIKADLPKPYKESDHGFDEHLGGDW